MSTKIFISTNIFQVVLREAEPSCKEFFQNFEISFIPKINNE